MLRVSTRRCSAAPPGCRGERQDAPAADARARFTPSDGFPTATPLEPWPSSPKRRRRYVVTTDSDHGGPIYPDMAKDVIPDRSNQVWAADLTYIDIPGGFVYLAAILDAWSRKVVGYAISRSMNARIAIAALKAALRNRAPPKGCIHHSDRGSQYASEAYRKLLADHKLTGSMSRRGNPYDNAKAEAS